MFGWDSMLQRMTSLQNRWGDIAETASREASVGAYLSYLQEVDLRRNPHSLDRNRLSSVCSGPEICKPAGGEHLVRNLDLLGYPQATWQSSVALGEFSQHDEECLLLGGFEDVVWDALTRRFKVGNMVYADSDSLRPKSRCTMLRLHCPDAR